MVIIIVIIKLLGLVLGCGKAISAQMQKKKKTVLVLLCCLKHYCIETTKNILVKKATTTKKNHSFLMDIYKTHKSINIWHVSYFKVMEGMGISKNCSLRGTKGRRPV